MGHRCLASLGALAVVAVVVTLATVPIAGQAPTAAKSEKAAAVKKWTALHTAWGDPDLQGTWANNNATPLQRPKELEGRQFLTDAELVALKKNIAKLFNGDTDAAFGDSVFLAALHGANDFTSTDTTGNYNHFWLVDRELDNRTSLIVDPADGRIPPLTPAAQKHEAERAEYRKIHPYDGPEDIPLSERCVTRGLPTITAGYNSYYQIVQAPGYAVIQMEMMHDARIIPLDGRPHLDPGLRQWLGDSRGHWEGETLVVETTNFNDKPQGTSQINVGTSEHLRLIERFTRVGPNTITYEVTVEDPMTWTRPWTAKIPWKQTTDRLYEFACHEGNEAMPGTLGGARVQEQALAGAASGK